MALNLTFVIFVRDEARRIEYFLRNVKWCGEILVMIDDRTVDNTAEIAKSFGARVHLFKHTGWTEGEEMTDFVIGLVHTDWIYWGYVDELIALPLVKKFAELSKQDVYSVVWVRRKNYNYGGVNMHNPYTLRFFKKGTIDFKGNIIGHFGKVVAPAGEILYLPQRDDMSIHHFSTYNLEKFELAHSRYSTLEAEDNIKSGYRGFSGFKLVVKPIYLFILFYVRGGAWRWGWRGLIICANYSFFYFNILAKMWEIENGVTLASIEEEYDRLKEKLLNENKSGRHAGH